MFYFIWKFLFNNPGRRHSYPLLRPACHRLLSLLVGWGGGLRPLPEVRGVGGRVRRDHTHTLSMCSLTIGPRSQGREEGGAASYWEGGASRVYMSLSIISVQRVGVRCGRGNTAKGTQVTLGLPFPRDHVFLHLVAERRQADAGA